MIDTLKTVFFFVAMVLPVFGFLGRRSGHFCMQNFLLAIPATLAAILSLGFILAYRGFLAAFFPLWGLFSLWVLWFCRENLKDLGHFSCFGFPWRLIAVCGGVFILQAIPVAMQSFPAGWDPACHALIAEKIRQSGQLCADWRPFEDLPMLYPQSLHVFAALLAMISDCPIHSVLQNMHLLFSFPAALLLWRIAVRIGGERAGIFAFFAYVFLTGVGNYIYFYRMGMLPTECANVIFLGLIFLLLQQEDFEKPLKYFLAALFGLGIFLVHPLSGVITVCIGVAVAVLERGGRKTLVYGGLGGIAAMGLYFLSVAGRATAGNTESIKFSEEAASRILSVLTDIGWAVLPLAAVGIVCAWKKKKTPEFRLALVWLAVLTGVFVCMEYIFRYCIARFFFGEDFTIGIPSRFIAVSGSIFCIWAGVGMDRLSRWRWGVVWILIFGICCFAGVRTYFQFAGKSAVPDDLQQLAGIVKREIPEEAYLVLPVGTPAYHWFSYLAWRPSLGIPLPSSENRSAFMKKALLFSDVNGNTAEIGAHIQKTRSIYMLLIPQRPGCWKIAVGRPDGRFRFLRTELRWECKEK